MYEINYFNRPFLGRTEQYGVFWRPVLFNYQGPFLKYGTKLHRSHMDLKSW